MIISGFPGIGKSFACRKLRNKINIKDDDSNNFYNICSDDGSKSTNPLFPSNYVNEIKKFIESVELTQDENSVYLISTDKSVRNMLLEQAITFTLIYPDKSLKDEYLLRYIEKGSSDDFIRFMDANFIKLIEEIELDSRLNLLKLKSKEYLSDYLVYD